ncbi:LysM peptidoglycan-binding domain-containing protein [Blastococcus sp. HT6-30]|uniref:LysM peptidoglycan-binding domain-containing protein n=1 Tax=Blastococcus sp. HT6-30 TaxID=3144843 RepID=UPI00321AA544
MAGSAAATVRGEMPGAVRERLERRPERHLRVLPPVPRAYAVAPAAGGGAAGRSARGARPAVALGHAAGWPGKPALPPLRLTARGRRLVAALALLLVLCVVALGTAVLGGDGAGLELMGTTRVIVEPGDTLWSIASAAAGGRDVREVVDGIQLLNGLDGSAILPGQVLRLP